MGNDGRLGPKSSVATGMVAVVVRVDEKRQFIPAQCGQGVADITGQGGKLVIHHEDAILTHRDTDIAAPPGKQIDGTGHMGGGDGIVILGGQRPNR